MNKRLFIVGPVIHVKQQLFIPRKKFLGSAKLFLIRAYGYGQHRAIISKCTYIQHRCNDVIHSVHKEITS